MRTGEISIRHGEALVKGIFNTSLRADDPADPATFARWVSNSGPMMKVRWNAADTPEAKDALRGWFLRDWWRQNGWKPGVNPELLDGARSKIIQGRASEGIWGTMGRELATHTAPAVGAAAGGIGAVAAGSFTGVSETGVGAVALDLAGGAAGGMAAAALLRHTRATPGPRKTKNNSRPMRRRTPPPPPSGRWSPSSSPASADRGKK